MNEIARNPEIERLARELAKRDGTSPDEAVLSALRAKLNQPPPVPQGRPLATSEAELQKLLSDIRVIQDEYAALPFVDPDFNENSLYDENGLPA